MQRMALLANLPAEIVKLPIDKFIEHLLPPLKVTEDQFNRICASLQLTLYDAKSSKWNDLKVVEKETEVFREFGKVSNDIILHANNIIRSSKHSSQSLVSFRSDGSRTPFSERTNSSRPDGNGCLMRSSRLPTQEFAKESDKHSWDRIFRSDEYKLFDRDNRERSDVRM
jgi:hypothetical protein